MDSKNYLNWSSVSSITKNHLQNDCLLHQFPPKKKIRKSTKLINKKIKKFGIKTYSEFLKCKKKILKEITEDIDVTDESELSNDDYESFYNSLKEVSKEGSENNTTDWFSWLYIEKKGCNKIEPKSKDHQPNICKHRISIIENNKNEQSENETSYSFSESSNDSINFDANFTTDIENVNSSVVLNETFSEEDKNNLSFENIVNKKHVKRRKRNLSPEKDSINFKISESSDNDWNNEFIPSDFQAHSTKMFCSTFSEVNQKNIGKCSNLKLSQIETTNQPRDSGIEEDSREGNIKHENVVNDKCIHKITGIKKIEHDVININENDKKQCSLENTIKKQVSISDKTKDVKILNNLNKSQEENDAQEENDVHDTQNKKVQLKIIGEEKVMKKYKIIHTKDMELMQNKQNLKSEMSKINTDEKFVNENIESSDESNLDYTPTNIKKCKKGTKTYNNLNNNIKNIGINLSNKEYFEPNQSISTDIYYESDDNKKTCINKRKHKIKLKNKLKLSRSLYLTNQYEEIKQMKMWDNSDNTTDSELNEAKLKDNKKKSMKDDETIVSNSILQSSQLDRDEYNLLHDDENLNNSNQDTVKKSKNIKTEKKNLISLNKNKNVQLIKKPDLLSNKKDVDNNDSNKKVNKKTKSLSRNETIDESENEENYNNATKTNEKNSMSPIKIKNFETTNKVYFSNGKLDKNKNNSVIISDTACSPISKESEINKINRKIKKSCDLSHETEIDLDHNNITENCKKPNFIDFNTAKNEVLLLSDINKYFDKVKKKDFVNENKNNDSKVGKVPLKKTKNLNFVNNRKSNSCKESIIIKDKSYFIDDNIENLRIKNLEKNVCSVDDEKCKNDNKSNECSDSSIKNFNHIEIKEENLLVIENKDVKNINKINLNNNKIDTNIYEIPNNCISDDDDKSKKSQDEEIDDILSPASYKRLKSLKRLNLYEDSDEESDEEQLIKCKTQTSEKNIENKQVHNILEKNLKSLNNQTSDDQLQEIDVHTLSSSKYERSKSFENFTFYKEKEKFDERNSLEYREEINEKNNNESDDEEDAVCALTLQKLSQFKKMNLFNNSSSSEDEQDSETNKNLINTLKQKDESSQKHIKLDETDSIKFDRSNVDNESKIHSVFTNDSLNTKLKPENNKIVKSTSIIVPNVEDLNDYKDICVKVNDHIEEIRDLDENYENKKIINEKKTQESINTEQKILESEEMFSSTENLTEKLNQEEELITNKGSILDSNNSQIISEIPSTPQVEEIKSPKKMKNISDIIKKENLLEGVYESTMTFNNISVDEEIFILDVAKNVFDKNLVGEKISISKTALQFGNIKYEAFQRKISPTYSCVLKSGKNTNNSYKILNIRPVMTIVTRRKKNFIDLSKHTDLENEKEGKELDISLKSVENQDDKNSNKLLTSTDKNKMKTITKLESNKLKIQKKKDSHNTSLEDKKEAKNSKSVTPIQEKKVTNKTIKDIKSSKRKLASDFDDQIKNKELYCESLNYSDKLSSSLKTPIKKQKNADLNEDINKEVIKNEFKLKNETLEHNKVKSKSKFKKKNNFIEEKKFIVDKKSDQILFLPKNEFNSVKKPSKNETKPIVKKKRVRNYFDEDLNLNFNPEKKPKFKPTITTDSDFVTKYKKLKKKKSKTNRKSEKIVKSAIEQIINIVKNNIHFKQENHDSDSSDTSNNSSKDRKVNMKYNSVLKSKSCLSSSSEEDDRKYPNRSFQVMDKRKLENNKSLTKKLNKSVKCKKTQSGLFIIKDSKNVNNKIYFDE